MAPAKKDLQKFTESELKVNQILQLEKITDQDIATLAKEERGMFYDEMSKKLNTLKDIERDEFITQIDAVITIPVKNQLWENNHYKITCALTKCINEYGTMPTKNQLAEETGLSRQTIFNHINEYSTNPLYLKDVEQFRFLSNKVLARVFKYAINGDLKACRLYFDMLGGLNNQVISSTKEVQQNNYIQINNTVLSQDVLKQLNEEQLTQIETVLKGIISPVLVEENNENDNVSDNKS